MEHKSIIYPNRMTLAAKRFNFWWYFIVIGLTLLGAGVSIIIILYGNRAGGISGFLVLALLWFLAWHGSDRTGPIVISPKIFQWPGGRCKWSDIKAVRLAKEDGSSAYSLLLVEVLNKRRGDFISDYYVSNIKDINPMNAHKTLIVWLYGFTGPKTDQIMTLISQHTKVHPPVALVFTDDFKS